MGKISEWVKGHAWASAVIALVMGLIIGIAAAETDPADTETDDSELEQLVAENAELRDQVSDLEAALAEEPEAEEPESVEDEELEAGEQIVFRASGSTSTETETFTVNGPWELRWNVDVERGGLGPAIWLYDEDGRSGGSWFTYDEGFRGRSRINTGGTYYFDVSINDPTQWRLTVRELGS